MSNGDVIKGLAVLLSIAGLFSLSMWSGLVVARYVPNRQSFVPVLFFDASEPYLPVAINFDNTWDTSDSVEHYIAGENYPLVLYTKVTETENYEVFQYFPWYAANTFINYHESDPEQGIKVWVKDNKPVIYAISNHGNWNVYQVNSINDLYAYVQRGSHGLYLNIWQAFPCDAGMRITPDQFQLIDIKEATAHESEFTDNQGYFRVNEPGDLTKPWWDFPWFDNPDILLENYPQYTELLKGAKTIPLSVFGPLPSYSEFLINGSIILVTFFIAGIIWQKDAFAALSLLSFLAIVALLAGSFIQYPPEMQPLSPAVIMLRTVPFAFLGIVSVAAGLTTRYVWGRLH